MNNSPAAHSPVLVTGASGYIATWIVRYLLEAGHSVHATVRDPARASSVAHLLKAAEGTPGTLRLFKADLLAEGSFDEAMQGCELVMHTASPFVLTPLRGSSARPVQSRLGFPVSGSGMTCGLPRFTPCIPRWKSSRAFVGRSLSWTWPGCESSGLR